jgi:hypothetical protein
VTSFFTIGGVWLAHHGLYGVALVLGILVLPRLAAFGYFIVAAVAVLSARGEGRLTLRGPSPR